MLSTTLHLEVAKDDLRDQFSYFAWGWHIVRMWKLKTISVESLEVLTVLFLQQLENSL
jgi:hypothetical protein